MAVKTFNPEFWRWYLKKQYEEFEHLHENQTFITNAENVFGNGYNLDINLADECCQDSDGNSWSLKEYIALRNDLSLTEAEIRLEVEFERWKGERMAEQERMEYFRDIEEYRWYRRKGDDHIVVTEFDVILESIIEKYNIKTQQWERYYEGKLRYLKFDRPVIKEFKFDPSQTHSSSEFSKAVWEKDFLEVKNMRDEEVRAFWRHVDHYYKPRIVREFNHSGFIEFEGKKYFLAENVLIKFPERQGERLQLVAEQNGAFPIEDNKYVKPPENAVHLPMLDLGAADPVSGRYVKRENMLLNNDLFTRKLNEVEEHICGMVGGESDFANWGKLITAYIFSFFFMDEVYNHFKHVIFLYFYGEGNVGKGELAKRILDFWGINYLASLNTPKARNVDNSLENHSQIPVWIDEHVPQVPGVKADIPDQTWNSWFELKPRQTNMQKGGTWDTERKEVRTMPLFCSNFKPKTDHLLSRCLILHYSKDTRGPEKHVRWLIQEKELLQLLTLSFMQHYNFIDRETFIWDMDRNRSQLKEEVKQELKKKSPDAILQDRQIAQFATLYTIYHWLNPTYRKVITGLAQTARELENEEDESYRAIQLEQIEFDLQALMNEKLYSFVKNEIVKTAVAAARHDPLTDYIESIAALIQSGKVNTHHFNWTKEGHLKLWAKAIWDIYEHEKRGTEDMVRRDVVEEKLKRLSDLAADGELKTVNWKDDNSLQTQRVKGFYIRNAVKNELFRISFNYEKYRPSGAPSWYVSGESNQQVNGEEQAPF
jgi:hypothetical protein